MKTFKMIAIVTFTAAGLFFQSCQKDELDPVQKPESILPERFKVDIPSSLSSPVTYKSTNIDTLQGDAIYGHLTNFIHIGEHAADLVSDIILTIALHNMSQPMELTFISDDDGRPKHLVISENATFEGALWQYKMTVTDVGTSIDLSTSIALQIFWNKNPIKGIAILNPYNINRNLDPAIASAMYRIDYSEGGEFGYSHHMIVTLAGPPMANPQFEPYSISTLKMFVGRNGDVVSIYGNSEHPNAQFFNGDTGFDWAFTAAGKTYENIGVAEVGLPPVTLDSESRYVLLVEHSIKNVFTDQILDILPWIDPETLNAYLYNTDAPGFFSQGGFVQGGTAPGPQYNSLLNIIAGLTPYNPLEINQLTIVFD